VRSRAEREWTKRVWVGGAFSGRRAIPYSKVVNGPGRRDEQAGRILRQPARRVAQWRAKYDSDKIRSDLNRVTILDGPLLAQSGHPVDCPCRLSAMSGLMQRSNVHGPPSSWTHFLRMMNRPAIHRADNGQKTPAFVSGYLRLPAHHKS
jgi:hypothetical protein